VSRLPYRVTPALGMRQRLGIAAAPETAVLALHGRMTQEPGLSSGQAGLRVNGGS